MNSYSLEDFLKTIYVKRSGEFGKIMNKYTNKCYEINLENIKIPFGIEKTNYNSMILKINLDNIDFKNYISNIEEKLFNLQSILDNKKYILQSQILKYDNYEDKLILKIKMFNNKILTKVYKNNIEISIFDINSKDILDLEIIGNIYLSKDNKFILKWNINRICVK